MRVISMRVSECMDCPFLMTIDGFGSHKYRCPIINKESAIVESNDSEAIMDLYIWFSELCEFPEENN
jgi:hypothetical protein